MATAVHEVTLAEASAHPAPESVVVRFAGDSAAGAFMGSIFGYGPLSLYIYIYVYMIDSYRLSLLVSLLILLESIFIIQI